MNYQKEYYKLIEDLKYKLSKLFLNVRISEVYKNKIAEIELIINSESDEHAYYEAFLKAIAIEQSLNKYIDKHPQIILPPYENKSYLSDVIHTKSREIKNYRNQLEKLKTRVISCALTGSLLITAGAYSLASNREHSKEKLYLTSETTYYDNTDNTRYHSSYTTEKVKPTEVIIRMVSPWVVGKQEATREIRTYHINNMTYDEIISSKNYQKIIHNLTYDVRIDSMPLKNLSMVVEYDEPIYEVTEISQNQDKYIEKHNFIAKDTILALFAELLVYLLVLKINDGPLFESILVGATDIKSTEKIIDSKRSTLKLLKKQWNMQQKKLKKITK